MSEPDSSEATHQIGEVAEATGLSLRTIRHYHELSLAVPSARSAGGFRLYTDADIERITLVAHIKPLELSLEEIRQLLDTRDRLADAGLDADAHTELADRLAMFADLAAEHCRRLRSQLDQAEAVAQQLAEEARAARRSRVSR